MVKFSRITGQHLLEPLDAEHPKCVVVDVIRQAHVVLAVPLAPYRTGQVLVDVGSAFPLLVLVGFNASEGWIEAIGKHGIELLDKVHEALLGQHHVVLEVGHPVKVFVGFLDASAVYCGQSPRMSKLRVNVNRYGLVRKQPYDFGVVGSGWACNDTTSPWL